MFNQKEALEKILNKLEKTSRRIRDEIPYRTIDGVYNDYSAEISWWTNGFWPGILWLAYRHTKKKEYADWALGVEEKLDSVQREFYSMDHDAGFMWHLSAVTDFKLTGNESSARRGLIAASFLASRFNPAGSYIRAWNGDRQGWAIIDCMMNLAILYWAADHTKDLRYSNIAQAFAETVMRHFIREDGSAKHICEFDPATGEYIRNYGGQGYSEESSWSRGTAWALYGFAISAKYTGRKDFLNTAMKIANFFIAHLPEDSIPFSDFKAPAGINTNKDSSAAAIAASGMLLLSKLVSDNEKPAYKNAAEKIVSSLYSNYIDWDGDEAIIQKGCVAFHAKAEEGLQTSLIYGDYFFLEALFQLNGFEELF
jgi:unsaturated chondroitin disaccharide hydrolase